jgi:hypothetical protein
MDSHMKEDANGIKNYHTAGFEMLTNEDFITAVNARFGEDSVFVESEPQISTTRYRDITADTTFQHVAPLMDISPYVLVLESVDDDRFWGFVRFYLTSLKRYKQVSSTVVNSLMNALSTLDMHDLTEPVSSNFDAQVAMILTLQYYFS